jgi:hypothetical protein
MWNKTRLAVACGFVTLMAGACFAQNEGAKPPEQQKYFHLEFVVKEMDSGKAINARHYSTTAATGDVGCSIRTGSKVPTPAGGAVASTQYTYIDVGVNIDCRAPKEVDGNLVLSLVAEISSVATASSPPVIRQNKWNSTVVVPIGKPTVVFSSDDLTTKGQMQLELTATPIK